MARQSTSPVMHNKSVRYDRLVAMTSGRAGKVIPVDYIPVLRGDSASGRIGIDLELAEMPRPLLNGVMVNVQAWFVPKTAHPQFAGPDEFMHSYQGMPIKALGAADRTPPPFYYTLAGADIVTAAGSEFFQTLGIHIPAGSSINTDLIDAFNLIYNFRLAAHSSRLQRKQYSVENLANALALPRAFWPSGRFSRVVPDYEAALVVGSLDLDITAGQLPINGIMRKGGAVNTAQDAFYLSTADWFITGSGGPNLDNGLAINWPQLYADMAGQVIGTTLADVDKAREVQAFAKLRTAYAGNDATGFDNDDAIVATLMQGFQVPQDLYKRPWLLDSKRVGVGFAERHATDAANLDQSVTQGRASAILSVNLPAVDSGGLIIVTVELLPERLDERMSDEWLMTTTVDDLPDAMRDRLRTSPVDEVPTRRIDAKATLPAALYGYEPMNDRWNREFTRLGGAFYQASPTAPWTEQRSAIWQTSIVDPTFSEDHWLAPADFPHNVFSDTLADAFEAVVRHDITILGLTQIGETLVENSDDYEAIDPN